MILNVLKKIIRSRGWIIFLCIIVYPQSLQAQKFYFDQYSVAEGIAQSTIYNIVQDANDNIWLGTQAGVTKFDGVEFINFTAEDGLAENGIRAIYADPSGKIWFGHNGGGISVYNGNNFSEVAGLDSLFNSTITSIIGDDEGNMWITSEQSGAVMVSLPKAKKQLKYERFLGSRLSDRVYSSFLSPEKKLFFVTDHAVKRFIPDSLKFENLILNGVPRYFNTSSIIQDSRSNYWVGTHNGGLYKYIPEIDDTKMYDLIKLGMTSNWVSTLFEDSEGNIWIGTWGGGIARINLDDQFQVFDNSNGMPGNKVWKIIEDREGNILIGTSEHGLCVFKGDYFISYFEEDGLIDPQVWAIEQMMDGSYWFGTSQGISILQQRNGNNYIQDFNKLRGERVQFISEDQSGNIWIAANGQGVFTFTTGAEFNFEPRINRNLALNEITAMCIDQSNNLWVGTLDGLIYYEIDQRRVDKLTQVRGLAGNSVTEVYCDSKNRIWVGIEGKGVTLIEGIEFSNPDLGMNVTPTCFVEDQSGNIWIGTQGRGTLVFDVQEMRVIKQLTVREGLMANLITLLNCDLSNNIYIGTNKGLNKFVQNTNKLYAYNQKSGFVGIEAKDNATCLDRDGNVWFGTIAGVTRYNPNLVPRKVIEPLTHITRLLVNYSPYEVKQNMSLSHNQNSLIFDYRSISLNPEAVQYQIMMEGIDIDWRPPGNQTQVNYPALPPGKYTFKVKAKNSFGVWNDPPITLSFQIKPPFYLTWWFILSCVIGIGFLIFTYIKVRERALLRENRILEDKVKDRTAEVVAQKEELAQKNKDITDSIRYAKRIQFAILPPESPFPNSFILFKPKDIVSGDFYWFTEVDNVQFMAAVDCTGHGVPGAFMSIIGHSSLNKIVNQYGVMDPGDILSELNKEVNNTLHQQGFGGDVHDGMDIALIAYDTSKNTVKFSGAFNPMYLVRNSEMLETKADRLSIGRSIDNIGRKFTTSEINIFEGDMIYLFSDGYADQFGGEKLKKFKSKNMKELMVHIASDPVELQREVLDESIEKWRGNIQQVDDILIIGRKF